MDYVNKVPSGPLWDFYAKVSEAKGLAKVVEDSAPVHTAKIAVAFHNEHCFDTLFHPARSPDLNPIEGVWARLKKAINHRGKPPKNAKEMCIWLQEEWLKINIDFINSLVFTMPNHVQEVIHTIRYNFYMANV